MSDDYKMNPNDFHPMEGENIYTDCDSCRACGETLLPENRCIADGCPCNSPRGINHGLVAKNTCTCTECDPDQTGSTRISRCIECKIPLDPDELYEDGRCDHCICDRLRCLL
jgi:hypothetical protein